MKKLFVLAISSVLAFACTNKKNHRAMAPPDSAHFAKGTFGFDLAFLRKYKDVIVLGEDTARARVLIVKDFQGRVMTSTARGENGNSYGWVNYDLISSGKNQPHINPLGGEDRFWMGPEGGQFSIFFKKGSAFDFVNWQTPPAVDTETFDMVSATSTQATFKKSASLTNYQGFTFKFNIVREVRLLDETDVEKEFGISVKNLSAVAFESKNSITNNGKDDWNKKSGLISIWILGMFSPSDETTIVIPYEKGPHSTDKITDNYFGAIPSARMIKSDGLVLMKGDGRYRGKVGLPPSIAKNMAGSYDAGKHILTLIKFDVEKNADYVNSKWEIQRKPYHGDVVNSYNDGPLADGSQLGPFYELESSSPARELKKGETITHRHITLHLEGKESLLDEVAKKTLGLSLKEIANAFEKK